MHKNHELADAIRRTAYFLWEQDGRPDGRSVDYWMRAKELHLRQLAYDRWLAEGAPPDTAERDWRAAEAVIEAPDEAEP